LGGADRSGLGGEFFDMAEQFLLAGYNPVKRKQIISYVRSLGFRPVHRAINRKAVMAREV